jgi:hypothetical protein
MLKALHKVNTMKRETFVFTKGKHPFIPKLGYHTKCYNHGYMLFVQVVKMEAANQKQNWHENLVLTLWVTSEVTSYLDTCYPNLKPLKISLPDMASPSWWSTGSGGACT